MGDPAGFEDSVLARIDEVVGGAVAEGQAPGVVAAVARDCLDVFRNGTGNGVWADIWPCKQSDNENQKWTLQYLGYSLQSG
jgi:hypothetical protein